MNREPWKITREMFLGTEEVQQLVDWLDDQVRAAAPPERSSCRLDRLIVHALIYSGLRNSEFCRLRVRDTIAGCGESIFQVVETPRQNRTVYVPAAVSALIEKYLREDRPLFLPPEVKPEDLDQPLLFSERQRPFDRTGLYRRVVRILTAAGFGERASVQLMRHTYGYLAYLRTGGNLLFVQRQLGHSHPNVTSIYQQFVEESYAELADRIAEDSSAARSSSPRNRR